MLVEAITRLDVANYVGDLFTVYIIVIFLYVLLNMLFQFGLRPSYSRWLDVLLDFLRDCAEPFLRVFRRLLPMLVSDDRDHRADRAPGHPQERDLLSREG